jgi:hypothetical protein
MSEDRGFEWDRDEGSEDMGPLPRTAGPQMSDSKAMLEAKKQLAAEGYIVEGINDQEPEQEAEEAPEQDDGEDETMAIVEAAIGRSSEQSSVLEQAKVRLEKARLYEMIMSADIFEGIDADAKAISDVKREFSDFATERLEILLGMRQDRKQEAVVEQIHYPAHDLNEVEVLAIKDLAAKLTKGESLAAGAPVATVVKAPAAAPKQQGLRSLRQASPRPAAPAARPQARPAPVKERQVRPAKKPNGEMKQIHEMSPEELRARSAQVKSAKRGMPAQQPLPMPDGDGMTWGGGAQAGGAGGDTAKLGSLLARALGATGIEDVGDGA